MPKQVIIKRAKPIGDQSIPEVQILIAGEIGECDSLEAAAELYEAEAQKLFNALHGCLPGGVFDCLTAKMLREKASLLIIPHGAYLEEQPCPGCTAGSGIGPDHSRDCNQFVPF